MGLVWCTIVYSKMAERLYIENKMVGKSKMSAQEINPKIFTVNFKYQKQQEFATYL